MRAVLLASCRFINFGVRERRRTPELRHRDRSLTLAAMRMFKFHGSVKTEGAVAAAGSDFVRACLKIGRRAAARNFGCGPGGEVGASSQRSSHWADAVCISWSKKFRFPLSAFPKGGRPQGLCVPIGLASFLPRRRPAPGYSPTLRLVTRRDRRNSTSSEFSVRLLGGIIGIRPPLC